MDTARLRAPRPDLVSHFLSGLHVPAGQDHPRAWRTSHTSVPFTSRWGGEDSNCYVGCAMHGGRRDWRAHTCGRKGAYGLDADAAAGQQKQTLRIAAAEWAMETACPSFRPPLRAQSAARTPVPSRHNGRLARHVNALHYLQRCRAPVEVSHPAWAGGRGRGDQFKVTDSQISNCQCQRRQPGAAL